MTIVKNLLDVKKKIATLSVQSQRDPTDVGLLAVSKKKPISMIQEAYASGQRAFGENYVQEAVEKIQQLSGLTIEWHMIGHVQSNKVKLVAKYFDWVQTVNCISLAKKLNICRSDITTPLNVCVQVNISEEPQKSGVTLDEVADLCAEIDVLPHLKLRGLMAIGENSGDASLLQEMYENFFNLYQALKLQYMTIDTLSLGMSNDMALAIASGSTMVRIGTAIFGKR